MNEWDLRGRPGGENKWFRSQVHSQQAALKPGFALSCAHQVSRSFLKAGLGFFAGFQFFTISSPAGISTQASRAEVWPLSTSFQPEFPFLPTLCHRGTGKQIYIVHYQNQQPKLTNCGVGWGWSCQAGTNKISAFRPSLSAVQCHQVGFDSWI